MAEFEIHSIEQPIATGNSELLKRICIDSPIPIALDEELIGVFSKQEKLSFLNEINPQFIVLKPSLHGGITGCKEWISLAEEHSIPWWITSALESNIGLNAVCQFTGEYANNLPQGLGTGGLYTNNIKSKLTIENGEIYLKKYE